jgi:excinuclease ABC subunit C
MITEPASLPDACGVYLFKGRGGKVLYVGKAVNIRARVRSHLQNRKDPKEIKLREGTEKIDWIGTKTELEALILEDTLIKRYKPHFNIRLKDDKSYPYLLLTEERFPAIRQVRGLKNNVGEHFGPHGDPRAVRRSLRWLRKIFPIRSCRRDMTRKSRPCLEYHLGRCMAPCNGEVPQEEYGIVVEGLKGFLSGKRESVLEKLEKEMWKASSNKEFERAALTRDLITGLKRIREGQRVVLLKGNDIDVIHIDEEDLAATVVKVREGRVIDAVPFTLEGDETLLGADADFISSYYSLTGNIPTRVIVKPLRMSAENKGNTQLFLSAKKGKDVLIRGPRGEDERSTVEMAERNTRLFKQKRERDLEKEDVLLQLKESLRLDRTPEVIEGFDISHLHGTGTVASMVQFRKGKPFKSGYRKFRIKTAENDDFTSMNEVVSRRYKRLLDQDDPVPDLVLIDGGKGQLSAALKAMEDLKMTDRPSIVSIAKKEEELFVPGKEFPIILKRSDPALRLLQRVRDEAHRFAVSYQRKLREKELDILTEVEGIGKKRARELLMAFDSMNEMMESGVEEICRRTSVPKDSAGRLIGFLEDLEGEKIQKSCEK